MKISVLGNIIDTENIYQITPIKSLRHKCEDGEDWWTEDIENPDQIQFDILFLNHKKCRVAIALFERKIPLSDAMASIVKLREKVISYWSNNQTDIPKIEFEEVKSISNLEEPWSHPDENLEG